MFQQFVTQRLRTDGQSSANVGPRPTSARNVASIAIRAPALLKRNRARVSSALLVQRCFRSRRTPAVRSRLLLAIRRFQMLVQSDFTGFLLDCRRRRSIGIIRPRTATGSRRTLPRSLFVRLARAVLVLSVSAISTRRLRWRRACGNTSSTACSICSLVAVSSKRIAPQTMSQRHRRNSLHVFVSNRSTAFKRSQRTRSAHDRQFATMTIDFKIRAKLRDLLQHGSCNVDLAADLRAPA